MTFITIINSILALAIISAIVAGHLWAITSSRPATGAAPAPRAPEAPVPARTPASVPTLAPAPAMA